MNHHWNVLLHHHPLGALWVFLILGAATAVAIALVRRRGPVPRLLLRLNALSWILGVFGAAMAVVGESACAGLKAEEVECRSALKELSMGLLRYVDDWDERLPPADRWFDVVRDKGGEGALPHPCPAYAGTYAYAMNRYLAGLSLHQADEPAATVFLVEHPCRSPNETTTHLHPQAFRHLDAANIVLLDGHTLPMGYGRWRTDPLRWHP
jgi:hypothetical protein